MARGLAEQGGDEKAKRLRLFLSSLLPLWEKVAPTKSASDEGFSGQ